MYENRKDNSLFEDPFFYRCREIDCSVNSKYFCLVRQVKAENISFTSVSESKEIKKLLIFKEFIFAQSQNP